MKGILVSVLFVILTCHGTRADELLLSPNLNESSRTLIPCGDNSDCESYQDGLCQDGFCECNGTRFCEDKVETVVTKIGEFCKVDADCNIEHSVCKDDKCACEEGRVDSSDGRKCLMNSDQPCIGSSSCNGFDSEKYPSKCIPGKCECEEERPYCSNGIKFGFHEGGAKKIIDEDDEWVNLLELPYDEKFFLSKQGCLYLIALIITSSLIYRFSTPQFREQLEKYFSWLFFYLAITFFIFFAPVNDTVLGLNFLVFYFFIHTALLISICYAFYLVITALRRRRNIELNRQQAFNRRRPRRYHRN